MVRVSIGLYIYRLLSSEVGDKDVGCSYFTNYKSLHSNTSATKQMFFHWSEIIMCFGEMLLKRCPLNRGVL